MPGCWRSKGNFDDSLELAKDLAERYPVTLVNSVNPFRLQGQKTAAFEIVDALGRAPDLHLVPVGNAGNISSHWLGYSEYLADGLIAEPPQLMGFQAQGAAPIVRGEPVKDPQTIATAIRIGNPASWDKAVAAATESEGAIGAVTDREILAAYRRLAQGGPVRRAGERRQRRGSAPSPRRRPASERCHRRVHPHRPRPQGSGVGDRGRGQPGRGQTGSGRGRGRTGPLARCASPFACPRPRRTWGPGFDSFGLALDLCNEVMIDTDAEPGVTWEGEGAGELPVDGTDMVSTTIASVCAANGSPVPAIAVHGINRIPLERGLGSSSAAAVAGVVAADHLLAAGASPSLRPERILALAADIEGHPDNAAPATLGGFTIAASDGFVRRLDPHPSLRPVVLVPATRLPTKKPEPPCRPRCPARMRCSTPLMPPWRWRR